MEITLPDGKKAIVISQIGKFTNLKLEDGQEVIWPTEKLPKPDKEPEEIKVVIIPAIDRLREFDEDASYLFNSIPTENEKETKDRVIALRYVLLTEAREQFKQKWGLI